MKSKIIEIENGNYSKKVINEIVSVILDKKIVIMPSDTIYGFLSLPEIENKIREIKKRDERPFLYLISSCTQLDKLGVVYEKCKDVLDKYWPGSITFLMESGDRKLGLRIPNWNVLRSIVELSGNPLISTSVNFSDNPAVNDVDEIINTFQNVADLIIVDPLFKAGKVSTIVDISIEPFKIIREGSIVFDEAD